MKRVLALLLAMFMLFCFAACGDSEPTETPNNSEGNKTPSVSTNVEENKNSVELMYTFEDPSKPVVFDYPNLKCIEEGTSQVFKNSKYVIVYCRDAGECELKDIPTSLSEKFYNSTDTHLTAPFDSFSIEKTNPLRVGTQELLQINGDIVVKRGDGTLVNLPMQGYTFAKDETIYQLIGVLDFDSSEADQKEMVQTVEAMINTLRDER